MRNGGRLYMAYFSKEVVLLTIAAALFGQQSISSENLSGNLEATARKNKYQNRRLLVRYKDGTSNNEKDGTHFSVGAYVVQSFEIPTNLEVVEVAKGISLDAAQEFYREDPNVLYVEPDSPVHAFLEPPPTNTDPTDPPPSKTKDPRYRDQWGLNNEGQTGGTVDVDINAPEMWDEYLTGDKNIVIAVIDTGINYNHPDLKHNVWVNPGEIPGNNIDDDNNGVVDDVHGYNAVDETGDPMDDHGHGSHCSGIIGAEGQNNFGGRGVMQEVTIIGCKFLSAEGGGTTAGAIACLDYLRNLKTRAENPVQLFATSNSWGGGPSSQALQDAIQAHQNEGILFIAAASNDSSDNDIVDTYPADYPLANIVSVAATDHNDELAYFSNYGKRTVHVGAPGVDILSTVLGSDYEEMSGTSMATPFVAGLAGMIKANNPDLNYIQVKNLLMAGGTPIDALNGNTISGRRIRAADVNGFGSLTCDNQIVSGRLSPSLDHMLVPVGQTVLLSAVNINCSEPNGDIIIPFKPGNESIKLIDDGLGIDSAADDGMYTRAWLAERPGTFEFIFPGNDRVTITVYDPSTLQAYTYADEPTFNYRQIAGTALDPLDDWVTTIATPFPLNFGSSDQGFDVITVGSNGALSVTDSDTFDMSNTSMPVEKYVSLIAPFWDDLNPAAGDGNIFYDTIGTAPNREFVVEWRNVRHYNTTESGTFQVVFFENSSDILFNYLDVDFGSDLANNGSSATIGIQSTVNRFVEVSYNNPVITSNKGIRFRLAETIPPPAPVPPAPIVP
jgi:subtilisin family serine protease